MSGLDWLYVAILYVVIGLKWAYWTWRESTPVERRAYWWAYVVCLLTWPLWIGLRLLFDGKTTPR